MKDQTNDLVNLICVNKIENGLQMLSLEARIMIMDFKMAAREIVNSCRLGVLPMNLARKFQQIYCNSNTIECDITKLFRCRLVGMGVSLGKPRQIHLHLKIDKPELNTIKVFKLEALPFILPQSIHELHHYVHNVEHKSLSDVLTPSIFLNSLNKTENRGKLTICERRKNFEPLVY